MTPPGLACDGGSRDFMRGLCGEGENYDVTEPFRVEFGGVDWDCATNGHALLLMAALTEFEEREHSPRGKDLNRLLGTIAEPTETCSFADLRAWLDAGSYPEFCPLCPGDDCRECCGTNSPVVRSRFFGAVVDRRLLRRYIDPLTAETVKVAPGRDELAPTWLLAMGWALAIMPMTLAGDAVAADEFPPAPVGFGEGR